MIVDRARYGPLALVTGAAQGLGAAFARVLRDDGFDLLLVDVDPSVQAMAQTLGTSAVVADLATDAGLEATFGAAGEDVGLLVNNAAISAVRPFVATDPASVEAHLAVNVRAPLLLTQRLLPPMVARGRGGVVLLSSFAAFHGAPNIATYAGTRGFFLSFGESLWYELRGTGVDVLVACPGATDTEGFRATAPAKAALRTTPLASPDEAARELLGHLGRRPTHVAGRLNRLSGLLFDRLLPRALATRVIGANLARLYPQD